MERIASLKGYIPLFKMRIGFLITFSAIVAFIATGEGKLPADRLLILSLATLMASISSATFNHYFDRDIDMVMGRTRGRPLPAGSVTNPRIVLAIAIVLFLLSMVTALLLLNPLVALHLFLGAFVYAIVYTVWLKRRTWLNIVIGGLAGSFAILAGGASARPEICLPPVLLAIIMFFWTPSHFWSFSIYYRDEYERARIPMLPVIIGEGKTALYVLLNTVALFISSLLPFFFGILGWIYLGGAVGVGLFFIYRNIQLLRDPSRPVAWKNFKASMVYLSILFVSVIVDSILL